MSVRQDAPPKARKEKRKKPPANPLIRGILAFYEQHSHINAFTTDHFPVESQVGQSDIEGNNGLVSYSRLTRQLSISDFPKRYTIYPPLLLLPYNFSVHSMRWENFYRSLDDSQRQHFFRFIAQEGFRKLGISRIAITAPIAADTEIELGKEEEEPRHGMNDVESPIKGSSLDESSSPTAHKRSKEPSQNVLRSPSGLLPVYGDWGPTLASDHHQSRILNPTAQDFGAAFWTSKSQHQGIVQVWAPLYTMFSRGNISEKARILGLQSSFPGFTTCGLGDGHEFEHTDVVDFYVGIGYFAFCYLKNGVRRVYGWDFNPWSVEGLRRGCQRNGWGCVVVKVGDAGNVEGDEGLTVLAAQIRAGDRGGLQKQVRCVVFLGDNQWAAKVLMELQFELQRTDNSTLQKGSELNVSHTNLGLLPTSRASWRDSVRILTGMRKRKTRGWMHVHENVDVHEIEAMADEVVRKVTGIVGASSGESRFDVSCAHIEQVKTYAPGVMHCVFDIEIKSNG